LKLPGLQVGLLWDATAVPVEPEATPAPDFESDLPLPVHAASP
jgi:hypothetical protein